MVAHRGTPVHQPGNSPNPVLLGVYGAFITQAGLMKSLTIGDRTQVPALCPLPSSLPRGQVGIVGLKVPTLQSHGWFPWQPAPYLSAFPKSPH